MKHIGKLLVTLLIFQLFPFHLINIVSAVTINIGNVPSTVDESQEFTVSVSVECSGCSDSYLRGVFYPSGSNYFGFTKNKESLWINASSSNCAQYYMISAPDFINDIWNGTLEIKPDKESSDYNGPGQYYFKVGRYTSSCGSPTWSSDFPVTITGPSPMPTPTPTPPNSPTPTRTPTPPNSPTATKEPTATKSPTSTKTPTPAASSNSPTTKPTTTSSTITSTPKVTLSSEDSVAPLQVLGSSESSSLESYDGESIPTESNEYESSVSSSGKPSSLTPALFILVGGILLIASGVSWMYIKNKKL